MDRQDFSDLKEPEYPLQNNLEREKHFKASFIAWGPAKIMYLAYLASGQEPTDILRKVPNSANRDPKTGKPKLGITDSTISNWRQRDPGWAWAEAKTKTEPGWFHVNVALPIKLAALDARDLAYMLGIEGNWMGYNGKAREMLLMELNLLEQKPDTSAIFKELAANIRLIHPANLPDERETIDVTPTERHHAK